MHGECRAEETEVLLRRRDVLDRLCRSPAHVRDLVEETGQSRRTINRAVNELEDAGLVERGGDGIQATTAGRIAHDRLAGFLSDLDDVLTAEDVLDPVPAGTEIAPGAVAGCEPILATDPAPYRPLERVHDALADAERYRALVPTLDDPRTIRLLYEHVLTRGRSAELVVTPEVFETLREEFPRRMAAMADEDGFSVFVGDVPPFGLALLDHDAGSGAATTVHVVVLDGSGRVHGVLVNDAPAAVDWAETQYTTARSEATDRTNALTPDSDGGVRSLDPAGGFTTVGQSLPVALEREGFVGVDASYFGDEPGADPPTAWRAGLSLVEVHTGYAIQRSSVGEQAESDTGENTPQKPALTATLTAKLTEGSECIVLGPPGSGKSTICKQVACEWYDADRGPVLYRESDRGRPFSSVDDLVRTAAAGDGHALVVVEDALRPAANAVFEAVDRLADHDDVSVLLDARTHEWHDRENLPADVTDLEVVHVPPLDEADCERLVRHFERTTDREVEVSAGQLWSAVRDEAGTGEAGSPNEMLRFVHRLATYSDPLDDGPTALEAAVASVYEDVADDEMALSVSVLANALIAAGIGVERGLLYAVSDPGEIEDVDDPSTFEGVDEAIDRLEGRVLFSGRDGAYRTVHEAWATTFLTHLLDVDEDGPRRFGDAVTALLALAEDADRCEQIERYLDDHDALEHDALEHDSSGALEPVRTNPQEWADNIVEAVYDLCWRRSSLTPLFGDGVHDTIELPEVCSESVVAIRPLWLGEAFLRAGYPDRAERAYERPDCGDASGRRRRLVGLADIWYRRGEYERAVECHEEGLAVAREHDDVLGEAYHYKDLGLAKWRLGAYDEAREHFQACIERARRLDDPVLESKAKANLGVIAWSQGQYDRAREHDERRLDVARATGNRGHEANSLNNLGCIARERGAYDRARLRHEEALAIRRAIGYRSGEASCLNDLGHVAFRRGALPEAEAFYEVALDVATEVDAAQRRGTSHRGLGAVAISRGDYETATHHLDEAMAIFEEIGNRLHCTRVTIELARLALDRGELETARELATEACDLAEELGAMNELGRCLKLRGRIAAVAEANEEAREHWLTAFEIFENRGMDDFALRTLEHLVELCHEESDEDGARKWRERAKKLLAEAPDATVELHREWVDSFVDALENV